MTYTNPLRDPQDRRLPRIAGPCGMVLFGVTGDLSRKKVMPAIYDLATGTRTVEFAVMYLPTEGLYAEVARIPGLIDDIPDWDAISNVDFYGDTSSSGSEASVIAASI